MIKTQTLELDGITYAVPDGMSTKELTQLAAQLLQLRRIDYCYGKDYGPAFHFLDPENARVRFGTRSVYATEEQAKAARDAHNAALPADQHA